MRLGRRLRDLWAWSWLISLPICVVWAYWGWTTYRGWAAFGLRYDPAPETYELVDAGRDTWRHMQRRFKLALRPTKGPGAPAPDGLRTISLFVGEDGLKKLDSDLPYSGFEYVKAMLWDGQDMLEAKLRYRGDFILHWGFPKKSLRVRTKREKLFEGLRTFNLLVGKFPEQLNNYLGYRLASELGLLAPRVELVQVAINGKRRGLHVFCEQLDESTLRHNRRMPGDLYSGELLGKDGWTGISGAVFEHPELWEKASINNHYPEQSRAPLIELVQLLNAYPSEASHARLSALLDMQAWGRLSAFETLAQSYHFDHIHNWRLFYDANRGRFMPVVWDPIAWAPHFLRSRAPVRTEVLPSRIHTMLFQNGDFLRERQRALSEFFDSGLDQLFLAEVDQALSTAQQALAFDPNIKPLEPGRIEQRMLEFRESVRRTFADVEDALFGGSQRVSFAQLGVHGGFALEVDGRQPVERLMLHFSEPIERPLRAFVRLYHGQTVSEHEVTGALSVANQRVELRAGLLAARPARFMARGMTMKNLTAPPAPAYYELLLVGLEPGNRAYELLVDRGAAAPEPAAYVDSIQPRSLDLYRALSSEGAYQPTVWSGELSLEGLTEIGADLIIEPGTDIRLGPGASVIVRGRLLAEGSAQRPIRFLPQDQQQEPWGAFVLQGLGTSGSRLEHCQFALGSGLKADLYEYSAMFSVHDSQGVLVKDCGFRDGQLVDDMVHAVYAEIDFDGCLFERSLSDALDLDICESTLSNCRFINSGNDGVDLMTSRAVIVDSLFLNSGDKGISVGEDSALLTYNSRFQGCQIGLQVKDRSRATVLQSDFLENVLPVDAYKKNWRYDDGGHAQLLKCVFDRNSEPITADKHSTIYVDDSYFNGPRSSAELRKPRVVFSESVDDQARKRARSAAGLPERSALGVLQQRAASLWPRLDGRDRGARLE